jgi:hypothetical protein
MGIFDHRLKVTLRESDHRYFDQFGNEYISQSKFFGMFKNKFDAEKQSSLSAAKQLRESGIANPTPTQIAVKAEQLKAQWSGIGEHASGHGNVIHNALELYGKGLVKSVHPSFHKLCKEIYEPHLTKAKWFNEHVFFLENERIAGTADLPIARTRSIKTILDIDDFKTNVRRGIEFTNKYGNYMKFPLSHLEDCNYNHYSLQLSLYGYMAKVTHGLKIGSQFIRYIKAEVENGICLSYKIINYPVPFMYYEVEAALEYYMSMKKEHPEQEFLDEAIEP